ncbi:MAG: arginine--tRNA ligase [Candidatus Pacebacteria bacterium]|jgi:arginyl-tRNA synthetase|nr:arginine--tRNA ligase [Candidatus Paceibacterota bacterium]
MDAVLRAAINDALTTLGLPPSDFAIEHPKILDHGDYACNVAMVLSKAVGQSPRAIAEQLVAALADQIEYVDRIEIAGPGFLNFYLSRDFFSAEAFRVTEEGSGWGENDSEVGEVVLFEYTSPNLFKPLHIGNLVGNIVGESFTRLFEMAGADVRRMNYPSDIGLTVAKGVWGLQTTAANPNDIAALGNAYRVGNDAYENDPAAKTEIETINRALYAGTDASLSTLRDAGIATSRRSLAAICELLGTHFDTEITESQASAPGTEIVKANIGSVFTESNGAVIYEGEKVGLHTRVFLNSQGLPTYEAKDVGHFTLKEAAHPDWTQSIIVTGNEQTEYFKVLYAALRELFPAIADKNLEHIPTGFLTLTTGKMSSRKGNVLTGESLLAEVAEAAKERAAESRAEDINKLTNQLAVAAIKYQILRYSVGSNIVFDKEQALSFEGDSGPYLQYTYARALSVLEKARGVGILPQLAPAPEVPYVLERILYRFPEVIEAALADRAPHTVVTYLTELAGEFNSFYAHEKIADERDIHAPYKALLTTAVVITLKNGLWVLGIEAPEKM